MPLLRRLTPLVAAGMATLIAAYDTPGRAGSAAAATTDGVWSRAVYPSGYPRDYNYPAVYDSAGHRLIAYEGRSGTCWEMVLDQPEWRPIAIAGAPPSPRVGPAIAYDGNRNRLVVHGGDPVNRLRSNEVWVLPLDAPVWERLSIEGDLAIALRMAGHTLTYDPVGDQLLAIGGWSGDGTFRLTLSGTVQWHEVTAPGPPRQANHTATYDPGRRRLILVARTTLDVWALDLEALTWERLVPTTATPPERESHSTIHDPFSDRLILFGGAKLSYPTAIYDDIWAFRLSDPFGWEELTAPIPGVGLQRPAGPSKRMGHSAAYDPRDRRMIIFGSVSGVGSCGERDTWALSLSGRHEWSPIHLLPCARSGHSAIYDPARRRMVVFGGQGLGAPHNDTWEVTLGDTPRWALIRAIGTPPSPRLEHSAVYDPIRDRMIVFGGRGDEYPRRSLEDTWALWLGGTPRWEQITAPNPPLYGRASHAAVYDPTGDRMFVIGGRLMTWIDCPHPFAGYFPAHPSQTFALELSGTPRWTFVTSAKQGWHYGEGMVAILDPERNQLVQFGDYATSCTCGNHCGHPCVDCTRAYRNRLARLPLAAPLWEGVVASGSGPGPRIEHTAVYDPMRERMVVYGGGSPDPTNEVWSLALADPPAWTRLSPTGNGPAASRHAAIYDPVADAMWVFSPNQDGTLWKLSWQGSPTSTLASVVSVDVRPHVVEVVWQLGEGRGAVAHIERREGAGGWSGRAEVRADGAGRIAFVDRDVVACATAIGCACRRGRRCS